jgi:threonine dehydratase
VDAIGLDDVRAAAARLAGHLTRTPVVRSDAWDRATGFGVVFKCENLQRTGSFKIRGALHRLLALTPAERERGVVAFSSGNHAQAVALAARLVGTSAVIVMPRDAPPTKVEATRRWGAEVVWYDRLTEDREAVAGRLAAESGRVLVPPFDDLAVVAGQGTAALEFLEDVPDLDVLVGPVGGGGLMAGVSTVFRALRPEGRIFGVEPEDAHDTWLSFRKGERVRIPPPRTLADGLRVTSPGALTFPVLRRNLDDILLVSDAELRAAVRALALEAHLVVEPSGAAGAAAVLAGKVPARAGARVGVILSGGNVDPALLAEIVASR